MLYVCTYLNQNIGKKHFGSNQHTKVTNLYDMKITQDDNSVDLC